MTYLAHLAGEEIPVRRTNPRWSIPRTICFAALPAASCLFAFTGCMQAVMEAARKAQQGASSVETGNDFKSLGLAYHQYVDANNDPPVDWTTVEAFVQAQTPANLDAIQRLRTQGVVVKWGVHFRDARIGTSQFLLAHERNGAEAGGWALYLDGSVHRLDPEQVRKAVAMREGALPQEPAAAIREPPVASNPIRSTTQAQQTSVASASLPRSPADSSAAATGPLLRYEFQKGKYEQLVREARERERQEMASAENETATASFDTADRNPGFATATKSPVTTAESRDQLNPAARAPLRTWTDVTGKFQVQAELVGLRGGKVTLKRADGQLIDVPLDRLVQSDRDFAAAALRGPPSPAIAPRTTRAPQDTTLAGGQGGSPFRTTGAGPLLGIRYTLGRWGGEDTVGMLEAVFNRNTGRATGTTLLARPGYAVGGAFVDAGQYVNALRLVFNRQLPDGQLDPADSYTSDWVGKPTGRPLQTLGAGTPVLGIHGRRGLILDAVGLVVESP